MAEVNTIVWEEIIGYRSVLNTLWPIVRQVRRNGPRAWVVETVCNGISEGARTYATRRDALEEAQRVRPNQGLAWCSCPPRIPCLGHAKELSR